jgi:hypothetical protein
VTCVSDQRAQGELEVAVPASSGIAPEKSLAER